MPQGSRGSHDWRYETLCGGVDTGGSGILRRRRLRWHRLCLLCRQGQNTQVSNLETTLTRKSLHFDEILITGCTGSSQFYWPLIGRVISDYFRLNVWSGRLHDALELDISLTKSIFQIPHIFLSCDWPRSFPALPHWPLTLVFDIFRVSVYTLMPCGILII